MPVTVLEPDALSRLRVRPAWPGEAAGSAYVRLQGGAVDTLVSAGTGLVNFEGLPPGTYTLSAWYDRNGDGAWNPGQLQAYGPAEPFALHGPFELEAGSTLDIPLPAVEVDE